MRTVLLRAGVIPSKETAFRVRKLLLSEHLVVDKGLRIHKDVSALDQEVRVKAQL